MRNVTSAFLRALANDKRDYQNRLVITLADNTEIEIDNSRIWDNGVNIQDSVSANDVLQIGAAIINQGTFTINNIYDDYSEYDFDGAVVVAYTGLNDLDDGTDEEIKLGTYTVDETKYNGSLIVLTCLDNMAKFDQVYDTNLVYPATLEQIVLDACSKCGVTLDNSSLDFPHKSYSVTTKPSSDNTTYRQVISWAAQIAGCFARCNADGKLELRWYSTSELDNATHGLDGGIFDGANIGLISDYLNTEDGMTTLSMMRSVKIWTRLTNYTDFSYEGEIPDYLFADTDSCYAISDTEPSSHGHTNLSYINVCTAYCQRMGLKYQHIEVGTHKILKIKWKGYTKDSKSLQFPQYELEYEIFFTDTEEVIINFIKLPTNDADRGTSCVIENGETYSFTPATGGLTILRRNNGVWESEFDSQYYTTGDTADGGSFDPWDDGDEYDGGTFLDLKNVHFITSSYSSTLSTDDIVITGVTVVKTIRTEGASDVFAEYSSGTSGYVIIVEKNDFIDGQHGQDIANWLGELLIGVRFRKANLTHPSNPAMEAGDVAIFIDRKERIYGLLVSSTTFVSGNSQTTISSAKTPARNTAKQFTETTRNYVELRKRLKADRTAWEEAEAELSQRIDDAGGLYCTEVQESGATKIYYHDKPDLNDSNIVMLFSDVGFTLTADYQDAHPVWYGMTVDGTMIAAILTAIGVNADWINTGSLTVGGTTGNVNGQIIVKDSTDSTVVLMDKNGVSAVGAFRCYHSSSKLSTCMNHGRIFFFSGEYTPEQLAELTWADSLGCLAPSRSKSVDTLDVPDLYGSCFITNRDFIFFGKQTGSASATIHFLINESGGTFHGMSEKTIIYDSSLRLNNGNINVTLGSLYLTNGNINVATGSLYLSHGGVNLQNGSTTSSMTIRWYDSSGNGNYGYYGYFENYHRYEMSNSGSNAGLYVQGNISCGGTKNRVVETEHYGTVGMNAFETSGSHFADIGSGTVGEDGTVTIFFDPVFAETIDSKSEYQVFLTRTSETETTWVDKQNGFFIVHGEPGATFDWMIVGYQKDYVTNRMEHIDTSSGTINDDPIAEEDNSALEAVEEMVSQFNAQVEEIDYGDD